MASLPSTSSKDIAVWIVDDNKFYSAELSITIHDCPRVASVTTYHTCESALETLASSATVPDVIVLDIDFGNRMSGMEALPLFRERAAASKIIILTGSERDESVFRALELGAVGYLMKSTSSEQVKIAIEAALEGGIPLDPSVVPQILAMAALMKDASKESELTEREKEVLTNLVGGYSKKQIGELMYLSPHTVDFHIRHIYDKLQVHTKTAAISKAVKNHLI